MIKGDVESAFALVRPPGHHATRTDAMGFCLFNNVAIAARVAVQKHGLERVLIVDFDVHHGNGTQDIFYGDGHVLYISTHQYPLYPGTGRVEETGMGPGLDHTLNVPLPTVVRGQGVPAGFRTDCRSGGPPLSAADHPGVRRL